MGVLGKVIRELKGADPERQFERHLESERVAAETAEATAVVALIKAGPFLEKTADGLERQERNKEQSRANRCCDSHCHDARPLRRRRCREVHQDKHEGRTGHQLAPGRAREGEQHGKADNSQRDRTLE